MQISKRCPLLWRTQLPPCLIESLDFCSSLFSRVKCQKALKYDPRQVGLYWDIPGESQQRSQHWLKQDKQKTDAKLIWRPQRFRYFRATVLSVLCWPLGVSKTFSGALISKNEYDNITKTLYAVFPGLTFALIVQDPWVGWGNTADCLGVNQVSSTKLT